MRVHARLSRRSMCCVGLIDSRAYNVFAIEGGSITLTASFEPSNDIAHSRNSLRECGKLFSDSNTLTNPRKIFQRHFHDCRQACET